MNSSPKKGGGTPGRGPGQLIELSGSYWKSCTLQAGVKLDLFTAVGDETLKCEAIAVKLGVDSRGLGALLNALAAMDLLVKQKDGYRNASISKTFLSKNSEKYIGHIIMHHHHLAESWTHLDQAVKTGKPVRSRASFQDEKVRESFLMGMFNMAMGLAPRVAETIDLTGKKRLLDLGGGPGTYAIHFCLNNPDLYAKVYDLPTTRPFAEKTIAKFGLTDKIEFKPCNYLKDDIDESFDVAWLSHILHGEGPENCDRIIQKSVSALKPGGMIIIHDFILNDTMDGPLFPALFSLNMLLGTKEGRAYSEQQIRDMLDSAGVRDIKRIPFETGNNSAIMTGMI